MSNISSINLTSPISNSAQITPEDLKKEEDNVKGLMKIGQFLEKILSGVKTSSPNLKNDIQNFEHFLSLNPQYHDIAQSFQHAIQLPSEDALTDLFQSVK